MDAGSEATRAKRKQFGVLLCLPMALVLLLIQNGDFGTSPIYGQLSAKPLPAYLSTWDAE